MKPTPRHTVITGTILPAPACDLIDRLTKQFGVGFTLTDRHGAVVASTAERVTGSVDPIAARVASGQLTESDNQSPDATFVQLTLNGKQAGVLIAHAPPAKAMELARVCAIAVGMALDFAEAASNLGRENVNAGWLLYRLLRGSRHEANQAKVIAAVYGWNLFKQRVAFFVQGDPSAAAGAGRASAGGFLQQAFGSDASAVPGGQIGELQWVLLPQYDATESWNQVMGLATRVRTYFTAAGVPASVGVGYPHAPRHAVQSIRWSYREAVFAARIGARLHGPGVFDLRSLGPLAFFAPSAPSRRSLAGLVLGPLQNHPSIMETLQTFLATNMSVAETAEQLGMHRHTVRNHLERVHELTALDPRILEDAMQLKLALITNASAQPEGTR